ncbi:MAG: hypothetical protein AAB900_01630 [Patescibacteria group bacterium]
MNLTTVLSKIQSTIFTPLVALIIGWAMITFLWALVQYLKPGDAKGKETATKTIGWGVLILAVMVSVWGLVNLLTNTFSDWGANSSQNIEIPQMQ